MDKDKWMAFIEHLWATIGYWQLVNYFRETNLSGSFFIFTRIAVRDKLLMLIAHSVHLCEEIAKEFDVGSHARETLEEIKVLYEKGDTRDRSVLTFEDCGVKAYRDKLLAHPLDHIKELLGKDQYQISLKWETIEQTLEKIKEFCDEVEVHHSGSWAMSTYKVEVPDVEVGIQAIRVAIERADKYETLQRKVALKGKATVFFDWQKDELVLED
jgi:hypothetical protein